MGFMKQGSWYESWDGFREELCQGEEWKPRGIMGQIQPGAGSEKSMKAWNKTESAVCCWKCGMYSCSKQTQVLMHGGKKKKLFRDADGR